MVNNIEEQRRQAKEKMCRLLDEYFDVFEKRSSLSSFDINEIERLMMKNQNEIKAELKKVNGDLTGSIEADIKKNCPNCKAKLEKDKRKKNIKTMCGELEIYRDYCYCRECGYSETPLDEMLGLTELQHKMTKELMVETAYYGQNQSSFSDASDMIKRALNIDINKETVREVTEGIGRIVFEADTQKAEHLINNMHEIEMKPESEKKEGTIYIMTDGASVNTRVEDENGSTWRENKTVIAFTDKDMIKRKDGGNIIVKKEYAAFIGSSENFKGYVLNVAINAGYGKIKNVVIIGDGAAWIRNMCNELFPDATQILDLYHLKENIYTYAKYKFNSNEKEYVLWAEDFIEKVEEGHAGEALELLPEEEKLPNNVVNLRTYMQNNIDKINYPEYKGKGYFVGSGAIESANKVILQRRLKQAGMRWSVPGAQSVLTLRTKVESHLWESEVRGRFIA